MHHTLRAPTHLSASLMLVALVLPLLAACAAGDEPRRLSVEPGMIGDARGLSLPIRDVLAPHAGTIELTIELRDAWPDERPQTLAQLGEAVRISAEAGRIHARYNAGDEAAQITTRRMRQPQRGRQHTIRFAWHGDDDQVLAWMHLDDELVAIAPARPVADWPETLRAEAADQAQALPPAVLQSLSVPSDVQIPPALKDGRRTVHIDGRQPREPLHRLWDVANFALWDGYTFTGENDVQTLMHRAPHTRQVLVDFTLGGRFRDGPEMYRGLDDDGELITDFSPMLQRVTAVLDAGLRPWIMLEKVPPAMSDPPSWNAYGNTAPAADLDVWHRYVAKAVQALIDAFGREQVASWSFMVATEPDLRPAHWDGTRDQFMDHLDHTVDAVLSVLPEAQISPGNILNPAFAYEYRDTWGEDDAAQHVRARNQWGLDIIDHAGDTGLPMHFFSASWYIRIGMDNAGFDRAVTTMRARLDRHDAFEGIPIDIREFSVLSDEAGRRLYAGDSSAWSASFYASIARRAYDLGVRSIFEWDHATLGVLHPRGQVMSLLENMVDGRRLDTRVQAPEDAAADAGAIAVERDGRLLVLLFHHRPPRHTRAIETIELAIDHPLLDENERWHLAEWVVDERTAWTQAFNEDAAAAGLEPLPRAGIHEASPRRYYGEAGVDVFEQNIERYRRIAELEPTRQDVELNTDDGRLQLTIEMPAHTVRLLELSPRTDTSPQDDG